jgi:hypothetical protein
LPAAIASISSAQILGGIALQASGFDSLRDDVLQVRARTDEIRRKSVHAQVLVVADDKAAAKFEQHHALSHVVERQRQGAATAQSAISQKSRQSPNDANHNAGVPGRIFTGTT